MSTAVNRILKLLDPREREIVFWNYYTKSNYLDHAATKNVTCNWFRRIILTFSSEYGNSPEERLEESFWLHFLHRSTSFIIIIHALNIFLLFVMIITTSFVLGYTNKNIEHRNLSNISYESLLPDIILWLFISSLCMYFLVMFSKEDNLSSVSNFILPHNRFKAWVMTGNFIIISRFLLLVYMFTSSSILLKSTNDFDYSSCAVPERLPAEDKTIAIPFMRVLLDTGQVVLFSTVPFPHPFSFLFVIIEMSIQYLRIFGCSDRIPLIFGTFSTFLVITLAFIYCYVMISSISIQRGSKNNYSMLVALTELSNDKFQFIKLLCEEVKVPLELINNSIEYVKSENILDDSYESEKIIIAIQLQVYTINLLTDNILFLSKKQEGRFEFKSELVNVIYLLQKSMKHILTSSDISTYIECEYLPPKHQIYYSAQLILIFIRNIVYIAAFVIDRIKLRNKMNLVSSVGSSKSTGENKIIITLKSIKNDANFESTINSAGISPKSNTNKSNEERVYKLQNNTTKYHFEISVQFPVTGLDSITDSDSLNNSDRELDCNGFKMIQSFTKLLCAIHGNGFRGTKNALILSFPNCCNNKILRSEANNADDTEVKAPNALSSGDNLPNNEFDDYCICVVQSVDYTPVALLQGLQSLKLKVFSVICENVIKLSRTESTKIIKQCNVVMIYQLEYYEFIRNCLQYQGKIVYYGIMDIVSNSINITFDHTICHPIDSTQIGLLHSYLRQNRKSENEATIEVNNGAYFGENKKKSIFHYMHVMMAPFITLLKHLPEKTTAKSSKQLDVDDATAVNVFASHSFAKHAVFGLRIFTDEIERSYLKWNIINTSGSIFHPASSIDISYILMMIYHAIALGIDSIFGGGIDIYSLKLGGQIFFGVWAFLVYICVFFRKYIIYNYLEPNESSLTLYWKLTLNWLYIGNILTTILAIFDLSRRGLQSGDIINYSGDTPLSVEKLFHTRIGSFLGMTALSNFLISIAFTINLWAFKFVWPHSMIYLSSITAKWVVYSGLYLYRALPINYFVLYMAVFLPFYVTNFCVTFHFEHSQRTEFIGFREAIFNYVFMENIMDIFQSNVRPPINALNISRRNFLESIKKRILTMKWIKLSPNNVHDIFDTFNISTYNLDILRHKLDFQYNLVSSFHTGGLRSATIGIDGTEVTPGSFESFTTLLVVDSLLSLLSSMHREIIRGDINVFARIDTGLSLIKLNKLLFITVLTNAFNVAVANIKRRLLADIHSPTVAQELVIIVKETSKKATSNFNGFRPMEIEVIDTGISSEFHLHSKFEQQMLSCDMENNSYRVFKRITDTNERVNVQLITVHYKYILNITEKVNSIMPKKQLYLQAIDNHTFRRYLFDAYDTFVTVNISNQYNSSDQKKLSSTMVTSNKSETVATPLKSNVRTMVLFQQLREYSEGSDKSSANGETNSVQASFERSGWVVKFVSSFSLFYPGSEWLAMADCILIQYDEHNDYYSSNRSDTIVSYAAQLRLMGYKLAIIGLLPTKKEKGRINSKKDNIAYLDGLDHIIGRPILQSSIDEVNFKCDSRIIDSLLGLNLFLNNT